MTKYLIDLPKIPKTRLVKMTIDSIWRKYRSIFFDTFFRTGYLIEVKKRYYRREYWKDYLRDFKRQVKKERKGIKIPDDFRLQGVDINGIKQYLSLPRVFIGYNKCKK